MARILIIYHSPVRPVKVKLLKVTLYILHLKREETLKTLTD